MWDFNTRHSPIGEFMEHSSNRAFRTSSMCTSFLCVFWLWSMSALFTCRVLQCVSQQETLRKHSYLCGVGRWSLFLDNRCVAVYFSDDWRVLEYAVTARIRPSRLYLPGQNAHVSVVGTFKALGSVELVSKNRISSHLFANIFFHEFVACSSVFCVCFRNFLERWTDCREIMFILFFH